MSTNLESAFHLCQLSHPLLKASGEGSIVFLSSVAGLVALPTGSPYAAAKGGDRITSSGHSPHSIRFDPIRLSPFIDMRWSYQLRIFGAFISRGVESADQEPGLRMGQGPDPRQRRRPLVHQHLPRQARKALPWFVFSSLRVLLFLEGWGSTRWATFVCLCSSSKTRNSPGG